MDSRNHAAMQSWMAGSNAFSPNEPSNQNSAVSVDVMPVEKRDNNPISLENAALALLTERCSKCHTEGAEENYGSPFDITRLDSMGSVLTRGKPSDSTLLSRIKAGEMPPADSEIPHLNPQETQLVEKWIASLLEARPAIAFNTELDMIADDFRLQPKPESVFYFSLRNQFNRSFVSDSDLAIMWAAFLKLINSLSWQSELYDPETLDAAETIYRVDIRRLGWSIDQLSALLEEYPYTLIPLGISVDDVRWKLASEHVFRIDWFIAAASSPDHYHGLLFDSRDINSLAKLLAELGLDYEKEFSLPGKVDRGYIDLGDRGSGPSDNYRVVDVLESTHGPVWISHDFASNDGVQNVDIRPWGPPSPNRIDSAFQQDGGEIIFQLPNGMLGFLIVDASGQRISVAPSSIVRDEQHKSPLGSISIANGISCFRCHANGFLTAELFVPSNYYDIPNAPSVIRDREEFAERIRSSNAHYVEILSRFHGDADALVGRDTRDPISHVVRLFNADISKSKLPAEFELWEDENGREAVTRLKTCLTENHELTKTLLFDRIMTAIESDRDRIQRRDLDRIYQDAVECFNFQNSR